MRSGVRGPDGSQSAVIVRSARGAVGASSGRGHVLSPPRLGTRPVPGGCGQHRAPPPGTEGNTVWAMTRRVDIVPHTHWDREWYSPFQTFRLRLVDLLDQLLPQLEADPSYAHFLLDGQMAVVDDYLAVRPEAETRIRALATSGRMAMGPWYALPDEFLVSGETLVRNLQRGLRVAARFGGAMDVGYLPDMFGHVAQMPQLFRSFGFEHAVVWRGVPSAIDRSGFWWSAPDGSTVRAEYLPQGYGNGALVPDDAKALVRRIGEFEEEQGELLAGPILWMNGTDHLMPQPWLGRVVAEANALDAGYELHICSLAEHVQGAPTEGLPEWSGELRSGARANLLMGVASNRVDVKQAAAVAERALERMAEPLSALFLPAESWPGALLDEAWLEVIRNSAHDSICACSVDEVCDAVLHRFAEATQIADGLTDRALHALGATVAVDGRTPVVVNPVGPHAQRHRRAPAARHRAAAGHPAGLVAPGRVGDARRRPGRGRHRDGQRARVRAQRPVLHGGGARRHRADHRRARGGGHAGDPAHPSGAGGAARRPRRRVGAGARDDEAGDDRVGPRRRRGRVRLAGLDRCVRPRRACHRRRAPPRQRPGPRRRRPDGRHLLHRRPHGSGPAGRRWRRGRHVQLVPASLRDARRSSRGRVHHGRGVRPRARAARGGADLRAAHPRGGDRARGIAAAST